MVGAIALQMPYFEPQESRTKQITARVPKSVKDGVAALARLWTHMERVRTGDPEADVTESDVVVRLLKIGIDGSWAEIGFQPLTEDQWSELLARVEKVFASNGAATVTIKKK